MLTVCSPPKPKTQEGTFRNDGTTNTSIWHSQSRVTTKSYSITTWKQVIIIISNTHTVSIQCSMICMMYRSLLTELAKLRNIISKQTLQGNHPALLCCILVLCFAILIGQFHPITYQSNRADHYTSTGKMM